jgi:hypothetical protein
MTTASTQLPENATLAANLREYADLPMQHNAEAFRVSA